MGGPCGIIPRLADGAKRYREIVRDRCAASPQPGGVNHGAEAQRDAHGATGTAPKNSKKKTRELPPLRLGRLADSATRITQMKTRVKSLKKEEMKE